MIMKRKIIQKIIIVIAIVLILGIVGQIAGNIIYYANFNRIKVPDYSLTLGKINYEQYDDLSRQKITYKANQETLQGYFYKTNEDNKLVVISHGFNQGADSLLPICYYFANSGYNVFTYDAIGCHYSSGKIYGFGQYLVSLEKTLDYLNTSSVFKDYDKYLFGFSAGGFSVMSVLNITLKNIKGCVSVSGFNDAYNLIYNVAKEYAGPLALIYKNMVENIYKKHFKDYLNYTACSGINNCDIPVYIANSKSDEVVTYETLSIANTNLRNENVYYYQCDSAKHSDILYDEDVRVYRNKVLTDLKHIHLKENKKEYVESVDHEKFSRLNLDLFNEILKFYSNC